MKIKLSVLGYIAAGLSTGYSAVYNVNNGTTASSNGIAPTGLISDITAPAATGTFVGFRSASTILPTGTVGFGVFGTYAGPGNTGLFTSLTDAEITGATSLATLTSSFRLFGVSGAFNVAGPSNNNGVFTRNTSQVVADSIFDNKNIYLLIGNQTTYASSTELLVLKLGQTFLAAQDGSPTALPVPVNTSTASLLFGRTLADVRTTGTDSSATPGWGTASAIPEPSAALLGAIGALGLMRRRRN